MWTTASGRTCDGEQDDFITVLPMFHCVLITEGKKMSWSDCLPVLLGNGVNCVFCCLTTVTQSRSVFVWSWFIQQYFISAVVTSKLNLDSPSFSISLISFFFLLLSRVHLGMTFCGSKMRNRIQTWLIGIVAYFFISVLHQRECNWQYEFPLK